MGQGVAISGQAFCAASLDVVAPVQRGRAAAWC